MSPNHTPSNRPRIDRNLPPDPEGIPTAPPPGKYVSNAEKHPEDFPVGPWPDFKVTKAPVYCAVDNRDGHQCFKSPLGIDQKVALAHILRDLRYAQMEIGYPSSNETEFKAVQELVSGNHLGSAIPQVLTLASINHIDRTLESLKGASAAIVHVYHTTSRQYQERHNLSIDDIIEKTVRGIKHLKERAKHFDGDIFLQISSESFQDTPMEHALKFYRASIEAWQPTPESQMIVNIPNTVERGEPGPYANRVHYISEKIKEWGWRDSVIVSVHTHDDCGGALQAAQMAVASGAADRVEGTLFGHGERSGNMSLSTFTGKLYVSGVDPEVGRPTWNVARRYEDVMGVGRRQIDRDEWVVTHPEQMISDRTAFVGPETRTVSTGVHADTTYNEFEQMKADPHSPMILSHLPYDPRDWGAPGPNFQATSQQGVTGMAAALEQECGIRVPEWMRREFYDVANAKAVKVGTMLTGKELFEAFASTFVRPTGSFEVVQAAVSDVPTTKDKKISIVMRVNSVGEVELVGEGDSASRAMQNAMRGAGVSIEHVNFTTAWIGQGGQQRAVACAEVTIGGQKISGAGISTDKHTAVIDAVVSAINRMYGTVEAQEAVA